MGLRLGQGVREGGNCAITLVTTGKLSRYLSGNLLRKFTHIIIDEVHDRSIDNDLSCLFVRDLLMTNPTIKVILLQLKMFDVYII